MLFYTYSRNNRIRAVYNGRFAFLHCFDDAELESVLSLKGENDFDRLWRLEVDDEAIDAAGLLAHEYMHKQVFGLSKMGLILTGWRLFARLRFVLLGQKSAIVDYYRARAIYYHRTVGYHEEVSDRLTKMVAREGKDRFKEFEAEVKLALKDTIDEADQQVQADWQDAGIMPLILSKPLYFRMGRWMNSSFSIGITHSSEEGPAKLTWTADGGIPNDIDEVREDERRSVKLMKWIISHGIVNHLNRWQTFEQVFTWCRIGQQAQFQELSRRSGITEAHYVEKCLHPTLMFVMHWAVLPIEHHATTLELFEDLIFQEHDECETKWSEEMVTLTELTSFRTVFGFFFLHGN